MSTVTETETALRPGGAVAAVFGPGYVERAGQVSAAGTVAASFENGGTVLLDAATGTGKTLAYLTPAAVAATAARSSGERFRTLVVVTTNALLSQIEDRDAPVIMSAFPGTRVTSMVGVEQYLCEESRARYQAKPPAWLSREDASDVDALEEWARVTSTGRRTELQVVRPAAWSRYSTRPGRCSGTACPHAQCCHYMAARVGAETADIVVTNYALLFTALSRKAKWIEGFDAIVCDEAHALADEARHRLGWEISQASLNAGSALAPRTREELRRQAQVAFGRWSKNPGRIIVPGGLGAGELVAALRAVIKETGTVAENGASPDIRTRARVLGTELVTAMKRIQDADASDGTGFSAFWTDTGSLRSAVLRPASILRRDLWPKFRTVVLGSATLGSGSGDNRYRYLLRETGADQNAAIARAETPFDHYNRVLMYVPGPSFPGPSDPSFLGACAAETVAIAKTVGGRVLVLCTSHRAVREIGFALQRAGFSTGIQTRGADTAELVRGFRDGRVKVLVGSRALATGLDVPGLDAVVIDRLPFPRPDDPVVSALGDQAPDQGAFFGGWIAPRVTSEWVQQFGRLMRRSEDRGIIATLDRRLVGGPLAPRFRGAKPRCRLFRDMRSLRAAWVQVVDRS